MSLRKNGDPRRCSLCKQLGHFKPTCPNIVKWSGFLWNWEEWIFFQAQINYIVWYWSKAMGIRTTNSDPVGFIYDSVTGLAIGECWSDTEEMEAFMNWWGESRSEDLRTLTPDQLLEVRQNFHIHFWLK